MIGGIFSNGLRLCAFSMKWCLRFILNCCWFPSRAWSVSNVYRTVSRMYNETSVKILSSLKLSLQVSSVFIPLNALKAFFNYLELVVVVWNLFLPVVLVLFLLFLTSAVGFVVLTFLHRHWEGPNVNVFIPATQTNHLKFIVPYSLTITRSGLWICYILLS